MSAALVARSTARQLAAAFTEAEAAVRHHFAGLVAAEERLNAAFGIDNFDRMRVSATRGTSYYDNFDDADDAVQRLSRAAWSVIVDRLELRRVMSIARWAELQRTLEKGELPPITEENVMAFAEGCYTEIPEMMTEAVQEVFEWLRPRRGTRTGDLKTNTELEIGKRVIVAYMVEANWSGGGYHVDYGREQHLTALENVLNAIDGKGWANKAHKSELETAIKASPDGRGETPLFRFRCCGNRNLHLEFKRLDLLERFNQIAGGRRLRPEKVA